jgi:diguanylate cyclase (GGDEF)-like protein/PAS domain S-box-containing protein
MAVLDVVLMGVGTFVLAAGFKLLTGSSTTTSSLWLANGFALGLLLTTQRARWPLLLAAAGVAGAASAFYLRADPAVIGWIALFNVLEVLVAATVLSGTIRRAADLTTRSNFLRFLGGAALLGPASMALAMIAFNMARGRPFDLVMTERVLVGHGLGMAVMAPVMLALRCGELRRFLHPDNVAESLLTLLLVAVTCALVFLQDSVPLLFLIFPPMILVARRGGFVGTAVALLLVVTLGTIATALGSGPIAVMRNNQQLDAFPLLADGYLILQLFTASLLVSLFPLIVSIAEGRRARHAAEELRNRLRLLMDHSSDVIILTDLDGQRLYVSPAVTEVFGMQQEEFLRLTWRDYVHEPDLVDASARIGSALEERTSSVLVFRARHRSGAIVWIEAHMKHFRDRTFDLMQAEKDSGITRNCGVDGDEGFVITLRDISQRRHAELELERANAELASLVRKDSLTGLANRRCFDEVLQDAWARALTGGWPIAVLMIDVDHFKQFNDCYGHQRGDMCLRDVAAAIITGLFHPDDVAARYGGEEFAVILPRTSTDNAALVAERIRRAVHDLQRPHVTTSLGVLTVSVGVAAAYPVLHGDPLAVVRAADQALYTSKNEGRNRTTLLDVSWPDLPPAGS